eukprot:GCRY01005904.1.p1 GENE.GCRY01005904.1~~GCRY01005904.1.p1  ORF type:complete len:451 (+),score=54.15 GCRY01005904.1:95-1447(+)
MNGQNPRHLPSYTGNTDPAEFCQEMDLQLNAMGITGEAQKLAFLVCQLQGEARSWADHEHLWQQERYVDGRNLLIRRFTPSYDVVEALCMLCWGKPSHNLDAAIRSLTTTIRNVDLEEEWKERIFHPGAKARLIKYLLPKSIRQHLSPTTFNGFDYDAIVEEARTIEQSLGNHPRQNRPTVEMTEVRNYSFDNTNVTGPVTFRQQAPPRDSWPTPAPRPPARNNHPRNHQDDGHRAFPPRNTAAQPRHQGYNLRSQQATPQRRINIVSAASEPATPLGPDHLFLGLRSTFRGKCNICNRYGHKKFDCPLPKFERNQRHIASSLPRGRSTTSLQSTGESCDYINDVSHVRKNSLDNSSNTLHVDCDDFYDGPIFTDNPKVRETPIFEIGTFADENPFHVLINDAITQANTNLSDTNTHLGATRQHRHSTSRSSRSSRSSSRSSRDSMEMMA